MAGAASASEDLQPTLYHFPSVSSFCYAARALMFPLLPYLPPAERTPSRASSLHPLFLPSFYRPVEIRTGISEKLVFATNFSSLSLSPSLPTISIYFSFLTLFSFFLSFGRLKVLSACFSDLSDARDSSDAMWRVAHR